MADMLVVEAIPLYATRFPATNLPPRHLLRARSLIRPNRETPKRRPRPLRLPLTMLIVIVSNLSPQIIRLNGHKVVGR
jgi:hypothetical protein